MIKRRLVLGSPGCLFGHFFRSTPCQHCLADKNMVVDCIKAIDKTQNSLIYWTQCSIALILMICWFKMNVWKPVLWFHEDVDLMTIKKLSKYFQEIIFVTGLERFCVSSCIVVHSRAGKALFRSTHTHTTKRRKASLPTFHGLQLFNYLIICLIIYLGQHTHHHQEKESIYPQLFTACNFFDHVHNPHKPL